MDFGRTDGGKLILDGFWIFNTLFFFSFYVIFCLRLGVGFFDGFLRF